MIFKRYLNENQLKGFERYKVKRLTAQQPSRFVIYFNTIISFNNSNQKLFISVLHFQRDNPFKGHKNYILLNASKKKKD